MPPTLPAPQIEDQADGSTVVDFDPQEPAARDPLIAGFDDNLAEFMTEADLAKIASELIEDYEADLESRKEWETRAAEGIKLLQVIDDKNEQVPFEGASRAGHPLLAEAVVQFNARALAETWPASGPVKGQVIGEETREKHEQRERVADFMNWQYTQEMREAFWEHDQMLFWLPFEGSAFKKVYNDLAVRRGRSMFVSARELVVPFTATSLETANRATHVLKKLPNDLKRDMRRRLYRECDISAPAEEDRDRVEEAIDDTEGREPDEAGDDTRHIILEMCVDYDLPGFDDVGDDGEATGIALPYVISIEKESQKVLAIRRNWRPDDPEQRPRQYYVHYKYLPGLGFYGWGLLHLIGNLAKGATGTLRALLDSAQFSNLQGGFKAKDAKLDGDGALAPGEWRPTEMTADELSKAFYKVPYGEPSPTLFQLLGFLVEAGQRFANITETMVGDADNKGPVGTTVALIEQGSKVFSTIHKRIHKAMGEEFTLMAQLNYETLPEGEPYPYTVGGDQRQVMRQDFDGRVDVVPVSDPNIFSSTQRIAQAQAVMQMASQPNSNVDMREAERRMLEALRVDEIDLLLPDHTEVPRLDAISENMALLHGKPIRTYPDQHHQAHMAVHQQWFATLPPEAQKMLQPAFLAHMGEHMAWDYRMKMQQMIGAQLPPAPDLHAQSPMEMVERPLPPEMERMLDQAAAQAAQMLPPPEQGGQPREDPEAAQTRAKIEREDMLAQAEIARKDRQAEADIARADYVAGAKVGNEAPEDQEGQESGQPVRKDFQAIRDEQSGALIGYRVLETWEDGSVTTRDGAIDMGA